MLAATHPCLGRLGPAACDDVHAVAGLALCHHPLAVGEINLPNQPVRVSEHARSMRKGAARPTAFGSSCTAQMPPS